MVPNSTHRKDLEATLRRPLSRLVIWLLLVSGCAPRALRTPEATLTRRCPQGAGHTVALVGFDREHAPPIAAKLGSLLEEHGYRTTPTAGGADLVVALDDLYVHVTSGATARRRVNLYFTYTLVAAWMIPVMGRAYDSSADAEAWLSIRDPRAGTGQTLRRYSRRMSITERPTGYPGENDQMFTQRLMDRVGTNLAVSFFEEHCDTLAPAPRSTTAAEGGRPE